MTLPLTRLSNNFLLVLLHTQRKSGRIYVDKSVRSFSKIFTSLPKRKKALSKIVKPGKEAHSCQHRGILLNRNGLPGQQHPHRGLGNAISDQIARRNINGEPDHLSPRPLPVLEGKIFVQEKAQDAPQNIVRRRGDPVRAARQVIERKHDDRPKNGVHDADNQKSQNSPVKDSNPSHPPYNLNFPSRKS